MVDKIEHHFLYLDQLGLSSELNTANMTSQIEKLLPLTQKRKWIKIAINNWNMSDISESGTKRGLKWSFNRSADATWQNGVSESVLNSVKRSYP